VILIINASRLPPSLLYDSTFLAFEYLAHHHFGDAPPIASAISHNFRHGQLPIFVAVAQIKYVMLIEFFWQLVLVGNESHVDLMRIYYAVAIQIYMDGHAWRQILFIVAAREIEFARHACRANEDQ
jgi:hypothetical protein